MLNNLFNTIIDSTTGVTPSVFIILLIVSLLTGLLFSGVHMFRNTYTGSFIMTLVILPAVVCVVIMMVNGNIGAGIAVAGTFSLVRFRSAPGTAREIGILFAAMGAGLILGMGYVGYAILFALILSAAFLIMSAMKLGEGKAALARELRITIPEDLDYNGVFDDLMDKYTTEHKLTNVKTTNMGSMFKLHYTLTLKAPGVEKEFIDQLRCRNGNLEIMMSEAAAPETAGTL